MISELNDALPNGWFILRGYTPPGCKHDMVGFDPSIGEVTDEDGTDTVFRFWDTTRGRGPRIGNAQIVDGTVVLDLIDWGGEGIRVEPMTMESAIALGIEDIESMDPKNKEHRIIYRGMLARMSGTGVGDGYGG